MPKGSREEGKRKSKFSIYALIALMKREYSEKMGNKYTLLDLIGTGGMAEVYKGKLSGAEGFEKLVVIKKLLSQYSHDSDIVSHFISEAKLAALLQHENIVQIYDFGELEGSYFIAMEYLFGKDLQSILQKAKELHDPMGVEQALFIIGKICEGMEYAHSLRDSRQQPLHLIHRDLSPHNIFVTFDGRVKIIDFGIARAELFDNKTQAGVIKGKISYMSPEQLTAEKIDHRSDIFAIGILLYEMLSGQKMYSGDTATMIRKCMHCEYEQLQRIISGLHPAVYEIVNKALEKDVGRRYQSCALMLADVDECLFSINKRPSPQLLQKYISRLFAEESTAERKGVSEFFPATVADREKTVTTHTASSVIHEKSFVPEMRVTREGAVSQADDSTKISEKLSPSSGRRRRRLRLLMIGGFCCFLLAVGVAVWQVGRKWDVGGADDFSQVPVTVRPLVMSSSPEPLFDPGVAAQAITVKASSGEIESLLAEAKEILGRSSRIGSRDLEIAEKFYRQVLAKDPTSKEASDGLERIRELYRAATEEELQASNFSQATNHMRKGMFLAPKDGRFSLLQESFAAQKQKLVGKLTEKAEEAMRSNRLIIPADDNAFQYYREILAIDPQNKTALQGITKIGDNYAELAESAFQNLKILDAKEYVRQGLAVDPQHPHLLQLQKDLMKSKTGLFLKGMEKYLKNVFQ